MPKRKKKSFLTFLPLLLLLTATGLLLGRFSLQRIVYEYPPLPHSVDVVVVGGGLSGLTAALTAAEEGAEVLYIHQHEPDTGGFPAFSPAFWVAGTLAAEETEQGQAAEEEALFPAEAMALEIYGLSGETANLSLLLRLSEESVPALAWVEALGGVPFASPAEPGGRPWPQLPQQGLAENFLIPRLLERLSASGAEGAGALQPLRLLVARGRVRGVVVSDGDGRQQEIYAQAVLLADGGYGANREMLSRFAGVDRVSLRPEGGHSGRGLQLAIDAGAQTAALDSVLLLPVFLPQGRRIGQTSFPGAVLSSAAGAALAAAEELTETIAAAGGRLLIIYGSGQSPADSNYTRIDDLQSLASGLGIEAERAAELTEGLNAPYYVAVAATVALTPGGIIVDEQMRVLHSEGVLEGLYAAGEITGGIQGTRAIPGFFFTEAVTTARIAGREAARWARR